MQDIRSTEINVKHCNKVFFVMEKIMRWICRRLNRFATNSNKIILYKWVRYVWYLSDSHRYLISSLKCLGVFMSRHESGLSDILKRNYMVTERMRKRIAIKFCKAWAMVKRKRAHIELGPHETKDKNALLCDCAMHH